MSISESSWCGTEIAVPKDENTNCARYSERLPSRKFAGTEPVICPWPVIVVSQSELGRIMDRLTRVNIAHPVDVHY